MTKSITQHDADALYVRAAGNERLALRTALAEVAEFLPDRLLPIHEGGQAPSVVTVAENGAVQVEPNPQHQTFLAALPREEEALRAKLALTVDELPCAQSRCETAIAAVKSAGEGLHLHEQAIAKFQVDNGIQYEVHPETPPLEQIRDFRFAAERPRLGSTPWLKLGGLLVLLIGTGLLDVGYTFLGVANMFGVELGDGMDGLLLNGWLDPVLSGLVAIVGTVAFMATAYGAVRAILGPGRWTIRILHFTVLSAILVFFSYKLGVLRVGLTTVEDLTMNVGLALLVLYFQGFLENFAKRPWHEISDHRASARAGRPRAVEISRRLIPLLVDYHRAWLGLQAAQAELRASEEALRSLEKTEGETRLSLATLNGKHQELLAAMDTYVAWQVSFLRDARVLLENAALSLQAHALRVERLAVAGAEATRIDAATERAKVTALEEKEQALGAALKSEVSRHREAQGARQEIAAAREKAVQAVQQDLLRARAETQFTRQSLALLLRQDALAGKAALRSARQQADAERKTGAAEVQARLVRLREEGRGPGSASDPVATERPPSRLAAPAIFLRQLLADIEDGWGRIRESWRDRQERRAQQGRLADLRRIHEEKLSELEVAADFGRELSRRHGESATHESAAHPPRGMTNGTTTLETPVGASTKSPLLS